LPLLLDLSAFVIWPDRAPGCLPLLSMVHAYVADNSARSTSGRNLQHRPLRPADHLLPNAASVSEGHSASQQRQRLLTAQTFRALAPDQAVALLTVDGSAFDDVLSVPQLTDDDLEHYT